MSGAYFFSAKMAVVSYNSFVNLTCYLTVVSFEQLYLILICLIYLCSLVSMGAMT